MKKTIKSLQGLKQVLLISQSKLKHLKGGEVVADGRTRAKVR